MRIGFAGTPQVAVPTLAALAQNFSVELVLTSPPAPVGRKKILTNSPVHDFALANNLPVLTPKTLKDADIQAQIAQYDLDAIAVVAYGKIIPQILLDVTKLGWFNLHFSLLPQWRGAAPVQAAVAAGQSTTGISIFQIDAGLDTGLLLNQLEYQLDPSQTSGEVLTELSLIGAQEMVSAFHTLASGDFVLHPQVGEASYAPMLHAKDAQINWNLPAVQVAASIHAYIPEPGPWTLLQEQRIKIGKVTACPDISLPVGSLHLQQGKVLVGCQSGGVELSTLTPAGKKEMPAVNWYRGLNDYQNLFFTSSLS